ncbi:hypothetical protein R3P38DRAFT_2883164 [Favolaschia claudopus]|uniref:DUF6699 domain-containing protein n=1 Tax=Favolaschia claudopus TaxID=2862362 RepID=A0AAW0D1R1_9AGAR
MPHKKTVQFKLTVDEYTILDSPESWTSSLPGDGRSNSRLVPPRPHFNQNLPLPRTLQLDPSLSPSQPLQLDFSFPSAAFRHNPQLTEKLLGRPACTPPIPRLHLRISAGLYTVNIDVAHTPRGHAVTVGDVLTAIQSHLRQYDAGRLPPEAARYMERRIETVNGYCAKARRDRRAEAQSVAQERGGGGRVVDHLLGQTLFAGITVQAGKPDHYWQVELDIPERYANA